jgi:hypothetical protein
MYAAGQMSPLISVFGNSHLRDLRPLTCAACGFITRSGYSFRGQVDIIAPGADLECGEVGAEGAGDPGLRCSDDPRCLAFSLYRVADGQAVRFCLKRVAGPLSPQHTTYMGYGCEGTYLRDTGAQ